MSLTWMRRTVIALLMAAVGATLWTATSAAQQRTTGALTKVVFQLDWIPSGQYAPFYLALQRGYYKDAGLDVRILPGTGTAAVIQRLEAGTAQIGFTDMVAVGLGDAHGGTVKYLSPIYQNAPYCIETLNPGKNVTSLKQLEGLTIATSAGSFTPTVIRGFMKLHGLDPGGVHFVNVDPSAGNSLLIQRKVPALETYKTSEAGIVLNLPKGTKLSSFSLAAHGLPLYSNGIVTTDSYLSKNPSVVRAFIKATLRGWQATARDPAAGAAAVIKAQPALKRNQTVLEIQRVLTLAISPDARKHGLGYLNEKKMAASYSFMSKYLGISELPPAKDLYANGYVAPGIRP